MRHCVYLNFCLLLQVPVGVVCNQGDLPKDKPAPIISGQFSAGIEKILLLNGVKVGMTDLQLYMDNSSQILRLDIDIEVGGPSRGKRPMTFINDYKHGKYNMKSLTLLNSLIYSLL